jgi:hypothetical protein
MTSRLTPVAVADREVARWREREAKLQDQLDATRDRIDQWVRVRDELIDQAQARAVEREHEREAEAEVMS